MLEKDASNSLFCNACADSISSLQNAIEQLEQTRDTMIRLCLKKHRKSSHEVEAPQLNVNLHQYAEFGAHRKEFASPHAACDGKENASMKQDLKIHF